MKKLFFVVMSFAALLLMACNGIETIGLNAESVSVNKKKSLIVRDINVSQNEAIGIANMFAHSNGGSDISQTKGAFSSTKMISSSETIREDGQNLMYVFNYEGGGFVIVGSTRNYYPILAYSDEGSFILQDDMGPVDVWLDETKVSIKNSGSLDNETKAQMQNLWERYDGTFVDPAQELLAARRPQTRSTGEDACWDEIEDLQALYGDEGWTFLPLSLVEDLFTDLGLTNVYTALCYCAAQNNSALNETVIGYKNSPIYNQVGPLLSTIGWHQLYPFNDLCPNNYPAGSGAIAVAQVMKYYEYPPSITYDGVTFDWDDIPSTQVDTSKQANLVRYVGDKIDMVYNYGGSWSKPEKVVSGLNTIGYTASRSNHNALSVRNTILNGSKPVIMVGNRNNAPIPSPAFYSNMANYWICDGVQENIYNQITFFTENQPYGAGTFTQGMYSINNPGIEGGIVYNYFHMKWDAFDPDSWYVDNNLPYYNNYQYYREDIFVTAP